MLRIRLLVGTVALLLVAACRDEQSKVSEAAAKVANAAQLLGPNDLQVRSTDRTVALEIIGDSVHVFMTNSRVSVPATYLENVRYADGRLRFDIRGIGLRMFAIGEGHEGAQFRPDEALQFVTTLVGRQAEIEARTVIPDSGAAR